jgi:hypothetical protein
VTKVPEGDGKSVAYPDIGITIKERKVLEPQSNAIVAFLGSDETETSIAIDDCSTSWVVCTGRLNVILFNPDEIC